jgi:drug/metabolite transporter superfamily protein YnfA
MQSIHDLLMSMTAILFVAAGLAVIQDLWHEVECWRRQEGPVKAHWKVSLGLALVAWIPLLAALGIVILSSGRVHLRG